VVDGHGLPLMVDGRRMVGPRPQFDGATRQQTYEFFPGQPEFQRFDRRHLNTWQRIGPREQLTGATVQGYTFTLPVSGPEPARWSRLVNVRRHRQGLLWIPESGNPISLGLVIAPALRYAIKARTVADRPARTVGAKGTRRRVRYRDGPS
jgi:hypothetical protein